MSNTTKSTRKAISPPQKVLYVGPTIPTLGLTRNTHYDEGVPQGAVEAMQEVPALKSLFLSDTTNYTQVSNDIRTGVVNPNKGGFYYKTFQAVAAALGGDEL